MTSEVRHLLLTCEVCQTAKTGKPPEVPGKRRFHAGRPWQRLAIDLVGPLPLLNQGNHWILVLMDHFTHWQDALASPDATPPNVVSILEERVLCFLGVPEVIHSDQGTQFESKFMDSLCKWWESARPELPLTDHKPMGSWSVIIEHWGHPAYDSPRWRPRDWDQVLPHTMWALRALPHASTKETTNYLMRGGNSD